VYQAIQNNGTSFLLTRHLKMAMQLQIMKMSTEKERVRTEVDVVEHLHRVAEGEATLHIGLYILRAQHTLSASTSFAVLRPIFGPNGTLSSLNNRAGIPGWFVAHICVGLLGAVEFVHEAGVVHGKISIANVMLSLYPVYIHHRYRGYPDTLLIGFSDSTRSEDAGDRENDVRVVLQVMEQVVTKWRDVGPFLGSATGAGGGEGEEPSVALLRHVQSILAGSYDGSFGVDDIRQPLALRLEDMRHESPQTIPRDLMKLLLPDLVTGPALDRAVQDPMVIRFQTKKVEMRRIVENVPVMIGGVRNAGMKTQRIMVMRFTSRKRKFLEAIKEVAMEDEDVEMGGVEYSGAETARGEMVMR
jgi:hypothetical protein